MPGTAVFFYVAQKDKSSSVPLLPLRCKALRHQWKQRIGKKYLNISRIKRTSLNCSIRTSGFAWTSVVVTPDPLPGTLLSSLP